MQHTLYTIPHMSVPSLYHLLAYYRVDNHYSCLTTRTQREFPAEWKYIARKFAWLWFMVWFTISSYIYSAVILLFLGVSPTERMRNLKSPVRSPIPKLGSPIPSPMPGLQKLPQCTRCCNGIV